MYSENILILTDWSYKDALMQVTLPYIAMKRKYLAKEKKIFFRTLEKANQLVTNTERKAIDEKYLRQNIKWLPFSFVSGWMVFPYGLISFFKLLWLCKKEKIGVIHIYCTPPGIIGYMLSLVTSVDIILDSYEPHAESMVENGTWGKKSIKFYVLFFFEKLISRKAKTIVSATNGMRDYAKIKYRADFENFYVKPACVNLDLFSIGNRKRKELLLKYDLVDKIVCVYAGKFGGIYLERETFEFFKVASEYFGASFRVLILTSHSRAEIDAYCAEVGFDSGLITSLFVSHAEIPDFIGLGDFAITPVKSVPTKRYCTPIKDGEYWALGLPIVITNNISDDTGIIEKYEIGAVLKNFNRTDYEKALSTIDQLVKKNSYIELYEKIRSVAIKYRGYDIADHIYKEIYC